MKINYNSEDDKIRMKQIFYGTALFIFFIWIIKIIEAIFDASFYKFGILPGDKAGLLGIFTSPFIHSDFGHLISNTTTLFAIVFIMFYSYPRSAKPVFIISYFLTGIAVWFFGREGAYHIGASGLVYALLSFLFFIGLFRKDVKAIAITLFITFMYGGFIWGVLPSDPQISYESHLAGLVIGLVCSIIFRKLDPVEDKYDWEEEDDNDEEDEESEVEIDENADEVYFNGNEIDEELERIKRKHNIK